MPTFKVYTTDEYRLLREMLNKERYYNFSLNDCIEDTSKQALLKVDHPLRYVMTVPLVEVPLFINSVDFRDKIVAKWRLKIGR